MLHEYRKLYSLHKKENIYGDISKDVQTRFDSSDYELGRTLPKEKNEKTDQFRLDALTPKTYSYRIDNNDKNNKANGTKSV